MGYNLKTYECVMKGIESTAVAIIFRTKLQERRATPGCAEGSTFIGRYQNVKISVDVRGRRRITSRRGPIPLACEMPQTVLLGVPNQRSPTP